MSCSRGALSLTGKIGSKERRHLVLDPEDAREVRLAVLLDSELEPCPVPENLEPFPLNPVLTGNRTGGFPHAESFMHGLEHTLRLQTKIRIDLQMRALEVTTCHLIDEATVSEPFQPRACAWQHTRLPHRFDNRT